MDLDKERVDAIFFYTYLATEEGSWSLSYDAETDKYRMLIPGKLAESDDLIQCVNECLWDAEKGGGDGWGHVAVDVAHDAFVFIVFE